MMELYSVLVRLCRVLENLVSSPVIEQLKKETKATNMVVFMVLRMSHRRTIMKMWKPFRIPKFRTMFTQTNTLEPIQKIKFDLSKYKSYQVQLYPTTRGEEDLVIKSIVASSSTQQILDIFNSVGVTTEKHSSQALVTLWDIQKLNSPFSSSFQAAVYFTLRQQNISETKEHPTFQSIVKHILDNCAKLEDEPLAACLLCLYKFKYEIRHPFCQLLLTELLKRKDTLSLTGLSRLCVCLARESTYGVLVIKEFLPILFKYIEEMSSNTDVKLVSIAVQNIYLHFSNDIIYKYRERLRVLADLDTIDYEPATLCSVLLLLYDTQFEGCVHSPGTSYDIPTYLIEKFSYKLLPNIDQLTVLDCHYISRLVSFHKQPYEVTKKLEERVIELFELNPTIESLDLMSCVTPKTVAQRKKTETLVNEYLDNCQNFLLGANVLYRFIKKNQCSAQTNDKFWSKAAQANSLSDETKVIASEALNPYMNLTEDSYIDFDTNDPNYRRRVKLITLKFAHQYMTFRFGIVKEYKNEVFCKVATREIDKFLNDYEDGKVFMSPTEYSRCIGFLICNNYEDVKLKPSMLQNFNVRELVNVSKAIHISNLNWSELTMDLTKRCEAILKENSELQIWEYAGMARVDVNFQRTFTDSPLFNKCFKKLLQTPWTNAEMASKILNLTIQAHYYDPTALDTISKYICDNENQVPLKVVKNFISATYICGSDYLNACPVVGRIINRNRNLIDVHTLPLLQTMMGLVYHGCLDSKLVHRVFSVEFLDRVDEELKTLYGARLSTHVRRTFMQLNRAVCLDMPDASIPWFHEKYCEELAATRGFKGNYFHQEVYNVLEEVVGPVNISRNVYSPYFYLMDFLIQLDKNSHPMPATKKPSRDAAFKIAIIVNDPGDFTTNVRQLKGMQKLKKRHLELLEYKVVNLDPTIWNSMYMSEVGAKTDYLSSVIFNK